jgi:hypothetical protein
MVNFMLQLTATAEFSSLSGIPQLTLSEWVKQLLSGDRGLK